MSISLVLRMSPLKIWLISSRFLSASDDDGVPATADAAPNNLPKKDIYPTLYQHF